MNMKMVEDALNCMEKAKGSFSAEEMQKVAWFAFKTDDTELTEKLVEELAEEGYQKEQIFEKFFAVADREEAWIEQIEMLLISIEILRIKEKGALDLIMKILEAYGNEIIEKEKADAEKEETERRNSLQSR